MNSRPEVTIPAPGVTVVITAAAAGALTVVAVRYAGVVGADHWDREADAIVGRLTGSPDALRPLVLLIGPLATVTLCSLLAVICLLRRRWRLALLSVLAPAATGLVNSSLQTIVGRTLNGGYALPSGHTAASTCTGVVLVLVVSGLTAWRTPTATVVAVGIVTALPAAMSIALISNELHVASDVVAGFFGALATVLTTGLLIDWAAHLYSKRTSHPSNLGNFFPEGENTSDLR